MSPYRSADTERFDTEEDKRPGRTAFQRDRARVLHSAALRRIAGKTQVVTPGTRSLVWDASPRTRLTHSLECAQVGRELGAVLGCDPDLVETACLAHDMGHPPFGHNGEQALNDFASDCGGFEGNAQSLRLLTRLEPKRFVRDPHTGDLVSVGLNLTRAALDAATKYPWPRGAHPPTRTPPSSGCTPTTSRSSRGPARAPPRTAPASRPRSWTGPTTWRTACTTSRTGCTPGTSTPTASTPSRSGRRSGRSPSAATSPCGTDPQELSEALDRLIDQDWWPHGYDGSAVAQARLKDATSQLIGRFCTEAETATRAVYGPGRLGRYGAELVVPRAVRHECAVLKAVADRYVMQRAEQEAIRADQRIVIAELAAALTARAPEGLEPHFRALFDQAPDDHARKRVLVDQIAALTDASARSLHAALTARRG